VVKRHTKSDARGAFTLVELMVATGLVLVLAVALAALISQTSRSFHIARSTVDEFQRAQCAFETLARRIGEATLNNYWDFVASSSMVGRYQRMSELRFVSGPMQCGANPLDVEKGETRRVRPGHGIFFQATTGKPGIVRDPGVLGLENLLNTWGYFVEVGTDGLPRPSILRPQIHTPVAPRLMELCEPTQRLSIYRYTSGQPKYAGFEWFRMPLKDQTLVHVVAENVAALIIVPKLTAQETERLVPNSSEEERDALLAPHLFYHSGDEPPPEIEPARNMRHRLPALVEITLVALDAATVARLYHPDDLDPLKLSDTFHDARQLRAQLQIDQIDRSRDSLERRLIDSQANYRLFTATVPIRSAQ